MLKKNITYKAIRFDADDNPTKVEVSKDHFFNLTKAEALEINLMEDLENVGSSTDPKAIIPVFKRIIHYSYGIKLPSGEFTKDPALTTGFLASDAYSELFLGLLQDGEEGVLTFIRAVTDFSMEELKGDVETLEPTETLPERKAPQDYKPSAREIAEKAKKEAEVASDPAQKYVVPNAAEYAADRNDTPEPPNDYKTTEEYRRFQAWEEARQAQLEQEADSAHYEVPIVIPTTPELVVDEATVPHNAFESQPLRRDARQETPTFTD